MMHHTTQRHTTSTFYQNIWVYILKFSKDIPDIRLKEEIKLNWFIKYSSVNLVMLVVFRCLYF